MARSATSGATASTVPSGQDVVLAADGLGVVTFGGEAGVVLTELAHPPRPAHRRQSFVVLSAW